MDFPRVVIVGRPNVGKSSILNWLAGRRVSVVDALAGVTRDRVSERITLGDRHVELIDTGGIGIVDEGDLAEHVERQIAAAMAAADVILFVTDTRSGITPLDEEVARRLRSIPCPVLCVANKTDAPSWDAAAAEFTRFGWPVIAVSAEQHRGREDLIEALAERLPSSPPESPEPDVMKLAIVGRRNVGKSTFINTLAREERMIVSEIPGTTRDSVDVRFEIDGRAFLAIDTPGVLRRKSVRENVEFYGLVRVRESIRRADVVLLFFDASRAIGRVDKQLAQAVFEAFKPAVFVVNKWDLLAKQVPTGVWVEQLRAVFSSQAFVPVAFITGKTGKNVRRLIELAESLYQQSRERLTTGVLNRIVRTLLVKNPPPLHSGRRAKIYFAAQVRAAPPTITLFCNDPEAFSPSYRRYILNAIRDRSPFAEIPIRLLFRQRTGKKGGELRQPALDELPEEQLSDSDLAEEEAAWLDAAEDGEEGDLSDGNDVGKI